MKHLLLCLFILRILISCAQPSPPEEKVNITLSTEQLKADLYYLSSDKLEGRDTGSEGIALAAEYIKERFKTIGLAPYGSSYFDSLLVNNQNAYNVVGVLPGKGELSNEIVIIGAHYDHIGIMENNKNDQIANGANDNASGSIAVLSIAEELAKQNNNQRTVYFVLFTAEEQGLLGSKHLAKRMKNENKTIYAMINFEMIGVPMQRDYLTYLTGYKKSNMADFFNSHHSNATGRLKKAKQFMLFMRSDNYPFYETFGIPAQTFSTFDFKNYDHYHDVNDEAELMDIDHIARVIQTLLPGIIDLTHTNDLTLH